MGVKQWGERHWQENPKVLWEKGAIVQSTEIYRVSGLEVYKNTCFCFST